MVTLQPRVTDPLGSILVPDTDLDELEVALLLTRMGNEPLAPVTSLPSCSDRNRSPEFDPGLAGEAPSGPRFSPGERTATSGTRSSGVVLLGRTESQMERMLPRDEQDMLEDRQSLTPRNVDGHERRNETGARPKIRVPGSLFSYETERIDDSEFDPENYIDLPTTNMKFSVSGLTSGRPSGEGTGRGPGDPAGGMFQPERLALEAYGAEARPDFAESGMNRRDVAFKVAMAQSNKGGHEGQIPQRYLESVTPSFQKPTYVSATSRTTQATMSYPSAPISSLLPSKSFAEPLRVRSHFPSAPENLFDPNPEDTSLSRRTRVDQPRSSANSMVPPRNSDSHAIDPPSSVGVRSEFWPETVTPQYPYSNASRDGTFNFPPPPERTNASSETVNPGMRDSKPSQSYSVIVDNSNRLLGTGENCFDEFIPRTVERYGEGTMNRGPERYPTVLDPRFRELFRQFLREESKQNTVMTSQEPADTKSALWTSNNRSRKWESHLDSNVRQRTTGAASRGF